MALMYMAATAMPYGGSYLAHARTKGSKNGISNTPGYVAVGDRAEGRLVNGRYVYDNMTRRETPRQEYERRFGPRTTTSYARGSAPIRAKPKNIELRARERMGGYARQNLTRATNALGTGNINLAARYAGNAARSTVNSVGRAASSAATRLGENASNMAARAVDAGREFITGEEAKNNLEYWKKRAGNNSPVADDMYRRAQAAYDRTLPGMIDKAKNVASEAWSAVKSGASAALRKGKSFLDGVFSSVKDFGSKAFGKLKNFGEKTISTVKSTGKTAMEWGDRMIKKVVGAVRTAATAVRTGAEALGKKVGETARSAVDSAREFVTGEQAQALVDRMRTHGTQAELESAQAAYDRTLPGIMANAGNAANNVTQAASVAVQNASRTIGSGLQTVGQAVTTAGGQVIQTVVDAGGQAYQLISDGAGNVISMISAGGNGLSEAKGSAIQPSSGNEGVIIVNGVPVRIQR